MKDQDVIIGLSYAVALCVVVALSALLSSLLPF